MTKKRCSIHIHQSSINKLKQFMLEGESYNMVLERLIESEEQVQMQEYYEKEYKISYGDVDRLFKVRFNPSGVNDVWFWDLTTLEWDTNINAWELPAQDGNIIKYLIKFMDDFLRNSNNMILLDAMGSQVVFDSVVISRI